eukprot:GSMAST32.ASY1.ANO1.2725.1 assembled CDS
MLFNPPKGGYVTIAAIAVVGCSFFYSSSSVKRFLRQYFSYSAGNLVGKKGRYKLLYFLNRGGTSDVWAAADLHQCSRPCAVKIVFKGFWHKLAASAKIENEVNILRFLALLQLQSRKPYFSSVGSGLVGGLGNYPRQMCSPIIGVYDISETPSRIFIVTELADGGELFDLIVKKGHLSESEAADIISQIISGVLTLHTLGILHRDLKPENILLLNTPSMTQNKYKIRICDFGLALKMESDEVTEDFISSSSHSNNSYNPRLITDTVCGSFGFQAPEYGFPADWFSVGCLLYIMLCGYPPFPIKKNTSKHVQHVKFDHPIWKTVSKEAQDLVSRLLHPDPNCRYNGEQAQLHPWLLEKLDS